MRVTIILILIFIHVLTHGQALTGMYRDYHGHSLQLNTDSTFRFDWKFDLIHTWAVGKWNVNEKTINFRFENVMDTLRKSNNSKSLVVSLDEKSNQINEDDLLAASLSSGGQSRDEFRDKLFIKGKRLYLIDNDGKLNHKKYQGIWRQKRWYGYKKWPTWYRKES